MQNWKGQVMQETFSFQEGRTGGVSGMVHEQKKIEDRGYNNFVFQNKKNMQVK